MSTSIVSKPIDVGISRQNSAVEAQHLIDGIFHGEKFHHGTTMEFSNYDVLNTDINHIDLDNPYALVESADVQIARIFPFQENSPTYVAMRTVLVNTVVPFLKKTAQSTKVYSTIGAKHFVQFLIAMDRACEKVIYQLPAYFERVSSERNGMQKENQKTRVVETIEKREVFTIPTQVRKIEHIVPVEPVQTSVQEVVKIVPTVRRQKSHKKVNTFIQIVAILYVELRYGGRLKNIDSI